MLRWRQRPQSNEEKLTLPREDRRALSHVPDPEHIRVQSDRRGQHLEHREVGHIPDMTELNKQRMLSLRYMASFRVEVAMPGQGFKQRWRGRAIDVSATGILLKLDVTHCPLQVGDQAQMRFKIPPGTMPEGFESYVNTTAKLVRIFTVEEDPEGVQRYAFEFDRPLTSYFQKKRWGYSVYTASLLLFIAVGLIMLLRVESIIYFKFHFWLYLYSMIAATFLLSRYFFGALYRPVPVDPEYTPGVSLIIPCFNEEQWIQRTIISCINQDYPVDKLEVIVVDDCSTDHSPARIREVVANIHKEVERFGTRERVSFILMEENGGKREALMRGVARAKHDLVVFVDSDSFLEPSAIRNLVQPFRDPAMGGVAGRTDVENKYTNNVTKLQTVRYYISFRIMKAAESWFDSVTCLSGPLSCYKKSLVVKHGAAWLDQKFLGQPATFGDDRSMTNFILKTHRTAYQDTAICSTIVPSSLKVFFKQQMRWKRSWLRESLRAGAFIWRKEPMMALFFYVGLIVPIAAPAVVTYNLVYVPLVHQVFPSTFLLGLLLMALLMSCAHLMFRRSKLWVFGLIFCVFYSFVLVWQMPIAMVTFWKSSWGTRETPQDIEERNRKAMRRKRTGLPF
nr:glycosyltransferase [Paenibacillus sabuli]